MINYSTLSIRSKNKFSSFLYKILSYGKIVVGELLQIRLGFNSMLVRGQNSYRILGKICQTKKERKKKGKSKLMGSKMVENQ